MPGEIRAPSIAAAAPANTAHESATTHKTAPTQKTATTHRAAATHKAATSKPAASQAGASRTDPVVAAAAAKPNGSTPVPIQGSTTKISLCVEIARNQASVELGHAAQWTVSAWTQGGNVSEAIVHLVSAPTTLSAQFNFGCGTEDGTSSCDLGEVAGQSAPRQLEAQVAVPATATSVKYVRLSVIASAAHLPTDPTASAAIAVTAAPAGGTGGTGGTGATPDTTTSPLPIGNLPYLNGTGGNSSTLSPGGNAGGLFPTVNPASGTAPSTHGQGQKATARTVANTSALPLGAPVVGAQLVGLGVLALAFVLAVTRLSIRRRPVTAKPAQAAAAPPTPGEGDKDTKES